MNKKLKILNKKDQNMNKKLKHKEFGIFDENNSQDSIKNMTNSRTESNVKNYRVKSNNKNGKVESNLKECKPETSKKKHEPDSCREYRMRLRSASRIVVKVGTSTLTYDNGNANFTRIDRLARVLSDLMNQGKRVILVTSGAIGIGTGKLKLVKKPDTIPEKQAVAAVGQCELMHIYSKFFSEYGHIVGQVLLTRDVVGNETSRKNVINTFETLLEKGIIPIVNENDTVSVAEIKAGEKDTFTENDTLAAMVSKLVRADLLIILSDVDGFYTCDPRSNPDADKFNVITEIDSDIEKCAGGAGTQRGTGGAVTRLNAAKMAMLAGVDMVLANGNDPLIINNILDGSDAGTLFAAKRELSQKGT